MAHLTIEDYIKENQKLKEEIKCEKHEKNELEKEVAKLKHEVNALNHKLDLIYEQLRLNKSKTFGRSSDTSVCEQLTFPVFNEAEMEYDPESADDEKETILGV